MEIKQTNNYSSYGFNMRGNLVVVEYLDDAKKESDWKKVYARASISFNYLAKAKALVKSQHGNNIRELLTMPDYVCEVL